MDCTELPWLSEMGLDNSFFMEQCDFTDSLDDEITAILGQDFNTCPSTGNNNSSSSTLINTPSTNSITSLCAEYPDPHHEPPPKLQKPNNFSSFSTLQNPDRPNSSAPIILDFGKVVDRHPPVNPIGLPLSTDEEAAVSEVLRSQRQFVEPEEQPKQAQTTRKPGRVRPPSQTYDHIVAERKRRELLSQRFVALSTIVPGLKKMDKTSVLGDAIKYLKHLQERVKTLEKQATQQTMDSVVLVTKSQITVEEEGSSDEKSACFDELPLPQIEARVCNSHILIRVHCERQHGVLVNLLGEVEKLNLVVTNTNVNLFGRLTLDITIVCEMEKEFESTVNEVVRKLRAALT